MNCIYLFICNNLLHITYVFLTFIATFRTFLSIVTCDYFEMLIMADQNYSGLYDLQEDIQLKYPTDIMIGIMLV